MLLKGLKINELLEAIYIKLSYKFSRSSIYSAAGSVCSVV